MEKAFGMKTKTNDIESMRRERSSHTTKKKRSKASKLFAVLAALALTVNMAACKSSSAKNLAGSYTIQTISLNGFKYDLKNNIFFYNAEMSISDESIMSLSFHNVRRNNEFELPFTVSKGILTFESNMDWDDARGEYADGIVTITLVEEEDELQFVFKKDSK